MVGFGIEKDMEPSGLWWIERGIWGKRKALMLVSGCGDWACGLMGKTEGEWEHKGSLWSLSPLQRLDLFPVVDRDLHCGTPLPTPVLGDLHLRAPWLGHQWCDGEVLWGNVNLATCLHLGLSWLQLLTLLLGKAGLDLMEPKRCACCSCRGGELSSVLHPSQI